MSAVAGQGARAGVAERWISTQAATPTPSQSPSPRHADNSFGKAPSRNGNSPPAVSSEPFSAPSSSYSFAPSVGDNSGEGRTEYVGHPGPFSHSFVPPASAYGSQTVPIFPSAASAYSFNKSHSNGHGIFPQSSSQQPAAHHAQATSLNLSPNLPHISIMPAAENGLSRLNLFPREPAKDGPAKDPSRSFSGAPENFYPSAGNEKLYEAYNDLHSLAQNFQKPFDAPAILVVGHQTDGKSALVEALMGFQFNHVGGGTKTRRPITLHMKYNAACGEPMCFLVTDDKPPREEEKTLEDLQAYIEAENMRLEREACQFWAKEIVVKIEYKYCPNLTIIDTPGLIAAAPGRKNQALQSQGRAVEALVRSKMQQKEFIILCLEDCSDWSNATTRRVVMQLDPDLTRTVVVSTKLDTRIPQFARPADVEMFLRPPPRLVDGNLLGETPFFTSVPSGRVGSTRDAVYRSNDHFREAVALRESQDVATLEEKLDRPLLIEERTRVGVSRLRWFLEQLLQWRYMESVPSIVPLLDKEYRSVTIKLQQTIQELGNLDETKLKERGRIFRDSFLAKLSLLLKGTVVAPPEKFGETLQDERVHGGAFVGLDGQQMAHKHIPNASMRLYGGAQYHRAMAEFRFIVGGVKCPAISREEIVNACGVEDIHDGTNYFRTACVIAVAKARDVFEPFLHQLGFRLSHVLRRLLPIALYLLQRDGAYRHDVFMKRVSTAFQIFVEATERGCREKCMEDLLSTTRYVTWSLHNKNRSGLRQFLDTFAARDQPSSSTSNSDSSAAVGNKQDSNKPRQEAKPQPINGGEIVSGGNQTTQGRLVDLLESTLWNRRLAPSSEEIVNALVAQIFEGIRDHFVAAAELKFNCFFLMPVVDKFPTLLREDLESAFDEDLDNVFDVAQARRTLEQQRADLEWELRKVEKLQEKFASIHHHLSNHQPESPLQKSVGDTHNSD